MTTEIAVSNRLGIALATDSAVTITSGGRVKVFNTADKLFELSLQHPMGVMINGNMECLGVPWEILVKDFRESEGSKKRSTSKDWMSDFLKYVEGHVLINEKSISQYVAHVTDNELEAVQAVISEFLRQAMYENFGKPNAIKKLGGFHDRLDEIILERKKFLQSYPIADSLKTLDAAAVAKAHAKEIDKRVLDKFQGIKLRDTTKAGFRELVAHSLLRSMPSDYAAGVVVAGYGCDETFPSLISAEIDGRVSGLLKISWKDTKSIATSPDAGQVIYFAQTDVIQRLLGGADPRFVEKTAEFIEKAVIQVAEAVEGALRPKSVGKKKSPKRQALLQSVADTVTTEYQNKTAESLRDEFSREFDRMIAMMPKQELIELAEALVSITAVERKATTDEGTVGGPIDVAFITKHEGFVWIKRKHYFSAQTNPRYFWRKFAHPPDRSEAC